MLTVTLKDSPEIKDVILTAFPGYKKRKAFVSVFNGSVNINSYWDGGSKSYFAVVNLETMQRAELPSSSHPYFDVARKGLVNATDGVVKVDNVGGITLETLPDNFVLVEAGIFCGKPATAHLFVPAANMPKFLKAGE